jgi:dimethylargininase
MQKTHALVRLPGTSVSKGLRMIDLGEVNPSLACLQHRKYREVLARMGFEVLTLSSEDKYPDSVFVEDPAIVINDILVITRLRREERQGEEKLLHGALAHYFKRDKTFAITDCGFVEGGDVLVTPSKLYIGVSARTDSHGADQLAKIAKDHARVESKIFEIPNNWLHLKGGASFHLHRRGGGAILANDEIADSLNDKTYPIVVTPSSERFGANCISNNGMMMVHAGRPKTQAILDSYGYDVVPVEMSEFEKIDGAITCLSKIFRVC